MRRNPLRGCGRGCASSSPRGWRRRTSRLREVPRPRDEPALVPLRRGARARQAACGARRRSRFRRARASRLPRPRPRSRGSSPSRARPPRAVPRRARGRAAPAGAGKRAARPRGRRGAAAAPSGPRAAGRLIRAAPAAPAAARPPAGRTWSPRPRGRPGRARAAAAGLLARAREPLGDLDRVDRLDEPEERPARRALLDCRCPTRCQRAPGQVGARAILGSASWTRFSPKSRTPAARASRTASAGCVLLTATSVTSDGRARARSAARAIRSRTAATRSAITS